MEALASPHPLIASDLGNRLQGRTVQREAGKVTAQFEDQRLNGGCLQGEVGALEAGIQQPILQTTDDPEGKRNDHSPEWGWGQKGSRQPGKASSPPRLIPVPPTSVPSHTQCPWHTLVSPSHSSHSSD